MKYFTNCKTLDELKKSYRKLAMEHHPDRGGDTETMKAINNEYEQMFNTLKNGSTSATDSTTTESAYDFISIIDKIIRIEGIVVELCGSWLWVSGDTKPVKDELKAAGFRWASRKKMWYWCPPGTAIKTSNSSMANIREKYGSRILSAKENAMACV